ncbi:MAG: YIP1 family protein, partial [Flavobacteriales bacterium]|nr:YIP1 family protein [Flavobacteriales bacterium]
LFLAGLIFGTLGTILFAWLFRWTGRLLGGKANGMMVFNVLVCAQTPLIVALASWFLAGILLNVIPHNNFERFSPMFNYVGWAVTWFTYALRLWAFVLLLVGLSVVHKFSMAKAAASIALSMLIVGTFIAAWWMISAQNFE